MTDSWRIITHLYNTLLYIRNNYSCILYYWYIYRSALTYRKHQAPVTSVAVLENSHSIVSGADNGTVHVWRVDYEDNPSGGGGGGRSSDVMGDGPLRGSTELSK